MAFAVVRVHHQLALDVLPEYHVGVQDAAELAQESEGVVQELLGDDVDHQDQLAHGELLGNVAGAIQTVPLALGVVAALVAVLVSVVVLAILVIKRTGEKKTKKNTCTLHTCTL